MINKWTEKNDVHASLIATSFFKIMLNIKTL